MSINTNRIHSYSYLFVVTLIFSAIATEFVILYLLFRESPLMPFEPWMIGLVICTSFSILGERLSKINQIKRWIFLVSVCSTLLSYEIFLEPLFIISNQVTFLVGIPFVLSFTGWWMYWDGLILIRTFISQRRMNKRRIVVISSVCALSVLAIFLTYIRFAEIVFFFDTHPWAMTLIGVLATLLGGIFIGRRTKKS